MRITRTDAAAFIGAIALALAAPHLSAQAASNQRDRGVTPAPAPAPPIAVERQEEPERAYRFYRPIVRVGQDYTLASGDVVGDVSSVFGDVIIEGRVEQDVVVVLGTARLGSTASVEGSLVVIGGSATIAQGAAVHRDLVVVGGSFNAPPDFSPDGEHVVIGSPVLGSALHGIVPWFTRGLLWGRLIVPGLRWMWVVVGIAFLVGLALNTIFDRPVRACADAILQKPLSAFLVGLLVMVLSVPAIAIIAATVIGLAIVPFVICALVVGSLIGKVGVARAVGRTIVHQSSPDSRLQSLLSFLIGFAVLCLAYMVPLIGLLTWAMTGILGLGAAAMTARAAVRREQPAPARVPDVSPVAETSPEPLAAEAAYVASATVPRVELGPPPEPVAAPLGNDLALFPRATFLDRVAAFAIDCVLVAIAAQILNLMRDEGTFPALLLIYHIAFWAWRGTTLGGIICSLRVVRTQGTELRFVDALVRGLSSLLSLAALGIGCFWMLQDPERQMWHDKIAGTLVVKVPRHMVLP